jgi:hypothetical protein
MQLPYDMSVLPWSIASSFFPLAQAWQSLQQRKEAGSSSFKLQQVSNHQCSSCC